MRVLVTGHKGYVGAVLVPLLLQEGHDVTGCDIDLFRDCTFRGSLTDVPDLATDIRELEPDQLRGFDAVIHLAGLSNDPLGNYSESLTDEINQQASLRLATLARAAGVSRFLFASSCSNYGRAGDTLLTEASPFNPVTPYGRSKMVAEQAIAELTSDAFSPTQLRAGTVYGVSPRIRFDLVLNNLTAWAAATGEVHLKSDGAAWRPLVHVADLAAAYLAILKAPRDLVHNEAFNIGDTRENYRVIDIAGIVCDAVPSSRIVQGQGAGTDIRSYRVDCGKIRRALPSYRPAWTARAGAEELYAALRSCPVPVSEFEGARFNRIDHVRDLITRGALSTDLRWSPGPDAIARARARHPGA